MGRILRTASAAEYCGLAPATLERMRGRREGPAWLRLSVRAVGYELSALDAWLDDRREASRATDRAPGGAITVPST